MKDPYETLGVARSATDKDIKDAFKKLARKYHLSDSAAHDRAVDTDQCAVCRANL